MTHYPPIQRRDLGICQRQLRIVASRGCLKDSHENILFGMWVEAPRVAGRRPKRLESGTEMVPKLRGRRTAFSNGIGAVVTFFVLSVFVVFLCVPLGSRPRRSVSKAEASWHRAAMLSPSTYTIH